MTEIEYNELPDEVKKLIFNNIEEAFDVDKQIFK